MNSLNKLLLLNLQLFKHYNFIKKRLNNDLNAYIYLI